MDKEELSKTATEIALKLRDPDSIAAYWTGIIERMRTAEAKLEKAVGHLKTATKDLDGHVWADIDEFLKEIKGE